VADNRAHRTKPKAIEVWLEGNLPGYRFGLVLVLLLVTFAFMASALTGAWVAVVNTILQGLTLLAALRASQVSRRLFRFAALVVVIALLGSLASLFFSSSNDSNGAFYLLSLLMVGAAPIAIGRALWKRAVIDIHTVEGAICIYVLIGMMYAFVYATIDLLGSGPFFVQTNNATTADYLYFSFVTITTVGYGDFTAASGLGRALASLEALLGQLYLVTIVATLVAGMNRARADRAVANAPVADETSAPGD
jgi:drug/metabolite transporter (DMT)-like permease